MRWLVSREFVPGTCSMAVQQADGSIHYERLQYRNVREGLVTLDAEWQEIAVFTEIPTAPLIALVKDERGH